MVRALHDAIGSVCGAKATNTPMTLTQQTDDPAVAGFTSRERRCAGDSLGALVAKLTVDSYRFMWPGWHDSGELKRLMEIVTWLRGET